MEMDEVLQSISATCNLKDMSETVEFTTSGTMGLYEPLHQIGTLPDQSLVIDVEAQLDDKPVHVARQSAIPSESRHEGSGLAEKVQRRLEQNREAARRSRLKKKVYLRQLESSRLKLAQLERDLDRAKMQGLYTDSAVTSNLTFTGNVNAGMTAFELEYALWLEEQNRQRSLLRDALQANISDVELQVLVVGGLNHYYNLFHMKEKVAKVDVFYAMFGAWRTSVEQFFLWMGGFRPSELLKVVVPLLDSLTDQQTADINKLRHSSQQAEDALSQGLDKLHQTISQIVSADGLYSEVSSYQIASAMEKLEALEGFINQADHLREHAVQLMSRILNPRQAARGLLALGEYLNRLRALSSLWAARPHHPT
ncbi:Transcription factor TGA4-like protein [Drosera capensis]